MTTITSSVVARELRQTLAAFQEFGIAAYTNAVAETPGRVTWHALGTNDEFLLSRDDLTVRGYLHWLENGHYSGLLADGALLQLTYDFAGNSIVGHRLAYVPCPVDVADAESRELLDEGFAWGDVVRSRLSTAEEVHMKTAVRFDYDPANANLDHPASHFTMNTVDCRIACATPVRVGRFFDFVFRTFYPRLYQEQAYLRSFTKTGWFDERMADEHRDNMHFAWSG